MDVKVFASGSSGNCLVLSDGDTNIMIDAGISLRRIKNGLAEVGLTIDDICGVLITHEHSDHVSGLAAMIKHCHVPVYAPHTVANRLCGALPDIYGVLNVIKVGESFPLGGVSVRAFHTPHDTDESVGYRISGTGEFALATDMGCVTEEVFDGLTGADAVVIESNHDRQMLCMGPYPAQLKRRILSDHGHLSNEACAELALRLYGTGTKHFILGHLSRENNTPALALEAVSRALEDTEATVCCAPPLGCLKVSVNG